MWQACSFWKEKGWSWRKVQVNLIFPIQHVGPRGKEKDTTEVENLCATDRWRVLWKWITKGEKHLTKWGHNREKQQSTTKMHPTQRHQRRDHPLEKDYFNVRGISSSTSRNINHLCIFVEYDKKGDNWAAVFIKICGDFLMSRLVVVVIVIRFCFLCFFQIVFLWCFSFFLSPWWNLVWWVCFSFLCVSPWTGTPWWSGF